MSLENRSSSPFVIKVEIVRREQENSPILHFVSSNSSPPPPNVTVAHQQLDWYLFSYLSTTTKFHSKHAIASPR